MQEEGMEKKSGSEGQGPKRKSLCFVCGVGGGEIHTKRRRKKPPYGGEGPEKSPKGGNKPMVRKEGKCQTREEKEELPCVPSAARVWGTKTGEIYQRGKN